MTGKVGSHSWSLVDLSDYIGYKVLFMDDIDVDSTATIVKNMNHLSMGPIRTSQRDKKSPFTPYSPSARHSKRANTSSDSSAIPDPLSCKIPKKPNNAEQAGQPKSWAKLVSKTEGFPDISLFTNSTGLGKILDSVDYETGEREKRYSKFFLQYPS